MRGRKTTELFASWKEWAERAGVQLGNIKTFVEAMEAADFTRKPTDVARGFTGLRLTVAPLPHCQDTRG